MCDLEVDKKFDRILYNIIDDALLDDLGEDAPSAVESPTTNMQVLATLAVTQGGLVPGACVQIITMFKKC